MVACHQGKNTHLAGWGTQHATDIWNEYVLFVFLASRKK